MEKNAAKKGSPRTSNTPWLIAGGILLLALIILPIYGRVREDSQRQTRRAVAESYVTDVALEAPPVHVMASEGPQERLRRLGLQEPPQANALRAPSQRMDATRPPQWSEPLAMPSADPEPPDPWTAPPVTVDPERKPRGRGVRRRSIDD